MSECSVCLGPCDTRTHHATLRVHEWFREFVTFSLEPVKKGKKGAPKKKFDFDPPISDLYTYRRKKS